jgi:hypothetical protein
MVEISELNRLAREAPSFPPEVEEAREQAIGSIVQRMLDPVRLGDRAALRDAFNAGFVLATLRSRETSPELASLAAKALGESALDAMQRFQASPSVFAKEHRRLAACVLGQKEPE